MTGRAFEWTDAEVRRALGLSGGASATFTAVSTDTRTLGAGALFVALVGENFDGHAFLDAAAGAGAKGAVVSREVPAPAGMTLYRVEDTLVALGDLALHRRNGLAARVVGITGSSGKTSTKEFVRAALEGSYRVHATRGNLNNRIGLPLTLLDTPDDAEVVVAEMGTNEPGEIRELTRVARPDMGVLTTVAESHLEKLVDLEGVLDEKLDLVRGVDAGGEVIVGDTPPALPRRARSLRADVRVAGLSDQADPELRPSRIEVDGKGRYGFRWAEAQVRLRVSGRHMASNAVLALAVADSLGAEATTAAAGVSAVRPAAMRGEERQIGESTLLVDCYNANPQSTRAALDTLSERSSAGKRIAVLGTMLELGARSDALHDEVLAYALAAGLDLVVATGSFAGALASATSDHLLRIQDPDGVPEGVRTYLTGRDLVLLKASRGVRLERVIPGLEAALGGGGV